MDYTEVSESITTNAFAKIEATGRGNNFFIEMLCECEEVFFVDYGKTPGGNFVELEDGGIVSQCPHCGGIDAVVRNRVLRNFREWFRYRGQGNQNNWK